MFATPHGFSAELWCQTQWGEKRLIRLGEAWPKCAFPASTTAPLPRPPRLHLAVLHELHQCRQREDQQALGGLAEDGPLIPQIQPLPSCHRPPGHLCLLNGKTKRREEQWSPKAIRISTLQNSRHPGLEDAFPAAGSCATGSKQPRPYIPIATAWDAAG